jgi:predicted ferric reductase
MISYETYKVIHILAALTVFLALGGALIPATGKAAKWIAPVHGTALLFSLVAGFGLLARLGLVNGMPMWAIAKLVIWAALGAWLMVAKRKLLPPAASISLLLALGALAAYFAVVKPGA